MITPENIRKQVESITTDLINCSLSEEQKFPSLRNEPSNIKKIDFGKSDLSIVLKNRPYKEIYNELLRTQSFNLKMIDGALIQLMYKFHLNSLQSHRLAFFPSPYLEEFQNNPEIYEEDCIYADIIKKNIVPFPLRFDFDCRKEVVTILDHPQSHLTLGQYQNCRIPVSAPLTPSVFINFILRNFYNTAFKQYSNSINRFSEVFMDTIAEEERTLSFVQLPLRKRKL
ncbi:MAG: DUF2290 domain-containing protein [Candidatus Cloacimonetes bacterium]|nr:DUF2290 domain-containing protein [Candidatus Cloacimonadota bacterium]